MEISLVVAAAENNAIGREGKLLWHLPLDMQYFNKVTMGHHVLMGRKSWDSLPVKFRPLPGRVNVVVTRQKDFKPVGCIVVSTLGQGIDYAQKNDELELMIIGGGEIYKQSLLLANRIYLTRVHHSFADADAFFPRLIPTQWKEVSSITHQADEKHKYSFDFIVLKKIPGQ